ncbi:hypothetical protein MMC07_003099 [Pseudocyphellaria aurata]|nr:hypothetical protein [Pseudocyphellaria aurata]
MLPLSNSRKGIGVLQLLSPLRAFGIEERLLLTGSVAGLIVDWGTSEFYIADVMLCLPSDVGSVSLLVAELLGSQACFAKSRLRVAPAITSRRARLLQPTLDICAPPLKDVELDADFSKRVQTRFARRAAAKAAEANVAAKRQEVPRVPRVARWPRQHAPTLESK